MFSTFLQLYGEQVQPLHPLLQFVLCRRCHGVHIFITSVIVFIRIGGKHLQRNEPFEILCNVFSFCSLIAL